MEKDQLIATLQQIKVIVDKALDASSQQQKSGKKGRYQKRQIAKTQADSEEAQSLPKHLLQLRSEDFFKQPKTAIETHAKLQPIYSCDADRVAMALLRLKKRKQLRKTSKKVGKKPQIAYVW